MSAAVSWTRKYMPNKGSDIVGQQLQLQRLRKFIDSYKTSRKRAALLYGATGSGKTCSVYAVANELNHEVLEINASDFRDASSIKEIAGTASTQMSLFGRGKVILVDEIDGISGQKDRGGIAALSRLIPKSAFPIAMTDNDPWGKKFSALRKASEMIEFAPLTASDVLRALNTICFSEKISAGKGALQSLANRSGGDLRAAVNDLQILSAGSKSLSQTDVDTLSGRNRVESMISAITRILKTTDFDTAVTSFDDVGEQPNEWFLWLDENLPSEYKNPKYLAKAYEALSSADVFNGRIARSQYWRLLVYIKMLLTAGVATAKDKKQNDSANYRQTSRLLKIWMANSRYNKRKNIAEKIADKTHTSASKVIQDIHYFKTMIKNSSSDEIANELNLDQEEVEWIRK